MGEIEALIVHLKGKKGEYIQPYTEALPTATTAKLGVVKPDGTSITVKDGVISANAGDSEKLSAIEQKLKNQYTVGYSSTENTLIFKNVDYIEDGSY